MQHASVAIMPPKPDFAKAVTETFSVSKYQTSTVYLSLNNSFPTSLPTCSYFSLCARRCKLPPSCWPPCLAVLYTHCAGNLESGFSRLVAVCPGLPWENDIKHMISRHAFLMTPDWQSSQIIMVLFGGLRFWSELTTASNDLQWVVTQWPAEELWCRRPYHICVRLYGIFDDTCVVRRWASVPAAVQPDQRATAVVACELTIWECRKWVLKINEIISS